MKVNQMNTRRPLNGRKGDYCNLHTQNNQNLQSTCCIKNTISEEIKTKDWSKGNDELQCGLTNGA